MLQVFELFDVKQNGVIGFGEFVRSLSIFHPEARFEDKVSCKSHGFSKKEALILCV